MTFTNETVKALQNKDYSDKVLYDALLLEGEAFRTGKRKKTRILS